MAEIHRWSALGRRSPTLADGSEFVDGQGVFAVLWLGLSNDRPRTRIVELSNCRFDDLHARVVGSAHDFGWQWVSVDRVFSTRPGAVRRAMELTAEAAVGSIYEAAAGEAPAGRLTFDSVSGTQT